MEEQGRRCLGMGKQVYEGGEMDEDDQGMGRWLCLELNQEPLVPLQWPVPIELYSYKEVIVCVYMLLSYICMKRKTYHIVFYVHLGRFSSGEVEVWFRRGHLWSDRG